MPCRKFFITKRQNQHTLILSTVDRINSFCVANLGDSSVVTEMIQKHPPRWESIKERVKLGNPIDNLNGLRDSLLDLRKGGSRVRED